MTTHKNLDELIKAIAALPEDMRGDLIKATAGLNSLMIGRDKILEQVKMALASLRTDVKYLVFDLEATRRERDVLRKDK